jgi:hypothetical protein
MSEQDWLAQRFEEHRRRLRAVAYRMLGSVSEADDAVQEAWLRLSGSEPGEIENLRAEQHAQPSRTRTERLGIFGRERGACDRSFCSSRGLGRDPPAAPGGMDAGQAIARVMGVSRNTVRAAIASDGPPKYERPRKGSTTRQRGAATDLPAPGPGCRG